MLSARGATRRFTAWFLPVALVVLAANLGLSFLRNRNCLHASLPLTGPYCNSDAWGLYKMRGLATHALPYLQPSQLSLPKGTLEYPVLTAYYGWLVALPTHDAAMFWVLNILILSVVAATITVALVRVTGARVLLFAAAPGIALYAFDNWDLLPVAAALAGLFAWHRGHARWASFWFGVGICLKVYPGLFLIPLFIADRRRGEPRPRAALSAIAPAAAVVLLTNAPFLIWGRAAWEQTMKFQSDRGIDASAMSLWSQFVPSLPVPLVNVVSLLLIALGAAVICFIAAGQADRSGTYNWLGVCAALVAVFLVFNKVCSLQYALWLLPFFVLLNVRVRWWLAYVAVDLLAYNAVWSWVDGWRSHGASPSPTAWMGVAIVARSVLLLCLVPILIRASPAWEQLPEPAVGPIQTKPKRELLAL